MAEISTRQEPNWTEESQTRVCYSCSVALSWRLRQLEPSERASIPEEGGNLYRKVSPGTQQHLCDICSKNTTKSWIPTRVYYTLLTLLGTRWPV